MAFGIPRNFFLGIPRNFFLGIPRNKGVNFQGKFGTWNLELGTITTLVLKT